MYGALECEYCIGDRDRTKLFEEILGSMVRLDIRCLCNDTEPSYEFRLLISAILESTVDYRLKWRFCLHQSLAIRPVVTSFVPHFVTVLNFADKDLLCEVNLHLSGIALLLDEFGDLMATDELHESFRYADENHRERVQAFEDDTFYKGGDDSEYFWDRIELVMANDDFKVHVWWYREEEQIQKNLEMRKHRVKCLCEIEYNVDFGMMMDAIEVVVKHIESDHMEEANKFMCGIFFYLIEARLEGKLCQHQKDTVRLFPHLEKITPLFIDELNSAKNQSLDELNYLLSGISLLLDDFSDMLGTPQLLEAFKEANNNHLKKYKKGERIPVWSSYFSEHLQKVRASADFEQHVWWFRHEEFRIKDDSQKNTESDGVECLLLLTFTMLFTFLVVFIIIAFYVQPSVQQ